ncbi:MAG TPA: glycosyltransferase family 2 protein [Baekduia sp.]
MSVTDRTTDDPRLDAPTWDGRPGAHAATRVRLMALLALPLALWYFGWLLEPGRMGSPILYAVLILAETFNLVQAVGFWWTASRQRARPALRLTHDDGAPPPRVDVFVPTYDEPVAIVEPTIEAATRMRGANVTVHVLDDGRSDAMRAMAARHGARYLVRDHRSGAKAGNINAALPRTDGEFVVVLDCDHVPSERFLEATLGHLADARVAMVQTPQYYANARSNRVAAAAWAQQALFFGAIARGKDGLGAMFCCGTNTVFRRSALEDAGGFPEDSVTEDFELSVKLHARGWRTAYMPEVVASGLGPEDMKSYISQQQRWARGCLGGMRSALRAKLPLRHKVQYLLSSMYFLSGWTVLIYLAMPIVRILTGAQPLAGATADQFLMHFAPYYAIALGMVAVAGAGAFTFAGFALATSSFWIHVRASLLALAGRRGTFVVTPKQGQARRQPAAVWPALAMVATLLGVALYGIVRDPSPATVNNVAFAGFHISILMAGAWPALARPDAPPAAAVDETPVSDPERERVAA